MKEAGKDVKPKKGDPRQGWFAAWQDSRMAGTYIEREMFRVGFEKAKSMTAPEAEGRDTNIECAAEGCVNTKREGVFVGAFCMPCHQALRRGDFSRPTTAAWGKLYADSLRTQSATQDAGLREAAELGFAAAVRYLCATVPFQDGMPSRVNINAEDYEVCIGEALAALSTPSPKAPATQVDPLALLQELANAMDPVRLGRVARLAREALGLGLREAAEIGHLDPGYLSRLEHGQKDWNGPGPQVYVSKLAALTKATEVKP